MAHMFALPGKTFIGRDALETAEDVIKKLGRKALIVTGKNVTKKGIVKILTDHLDSWGIGYEIFNDITGEPTDEMIRAGVQIYERCKCDFLIGIGGGSPLDSVKAIAAVSVLKCNISDLMGKEISGKFPPMVLIPTTAGTGSEATKFTIITDTVKDVKMLLKGDDLLPDVAVVDPCFTMTSPESITAATGMDALTHAIESYTSKKANELTDIFAISAVRRIFKYLPIAFKDGTDKKAREEMSIAAYEAGVCINNASVTIVHGMSRPIGALFHVPHGLSNAMLMKKCLEFAMPGCISRFADLARTIGVETDGRTEEELADAFMKELGRLCKELEIPTLQEYGIEKESFEKEIRKMASDAMASGSPSNTIREVTEEDIIKIYEGLW